MTVLGEEPAAAAPVIRPSRADRPDRVEPSNLSDATDPTVPASPTGLASPAAALEGLDRLDALLDELAGLDPTVLDGPLAQVLVERLGGAADRLQAVRLRLLPTIEADGRWALGGARSFPQWVARALGSSVAQARRDVRLGRALRDELPATAVATAAGDISLEHARVLATVAATSDARREALAADAGCNEGYLVDRARRFGPDQFRRLVRHWAALADPEADERGYRDAAEREFLEFSRTLGGFHLAGFLTEDSGQALATALAAVTGVPPEGDERTTAQRRAHALVDLARLTLDHGLEGTGAAVRPHLSVHVTLADLEQGATATTLSASDAPGAPDAPGELGAPAPRAGGADATGPTFDDGTPVPRSVLDRIACDSEVTRIVFGPPGVVLDVGRAQRTVTGQLRRAVIARDRHCQYPDCNAPPALGEVHHPQHWSRGGPTSVTNSVLLCWHHHRWVHTHGVEIAHRAGGWRFTDRNGRPLSAIGSGMAEAA